MPRSFLVKKYFRSKKPNYSELEGHSDLLERSPLAELQIGPNGGSVGLVWNLNLPPDLLFWASSPSPCPSPTGPLDLSSIFSSSSEEEDDRRTSEPSRPEPAGHYRNRSYSAPTALSLHQLTRPPTLKPAFRCKHCPKEYGSLGALKMHIRSHTLPCVCPTCGKAFSRPWLLRGHIRTHTGERPFSCPHCERAFADRSNLRAHLQTHTVVKRYHCAACPRSFGRISLLHKHSLAGCSPAP